MKHALIIMFGLLMSYGAALDVSQAQPAAQVPPTTGAQSGASAETAPQTSTSSSAPASKTEKAGEVLFVFLVLSVVFETALTPIFNWRIFLTNCEGKGVKTPVTVGLAFLVFWGYGLDVVKDLLVALDYSANKTLGGQFLTALLIAGGSDGVLRIFTKLGIRNPAERKEKADEARKSAAATNSSRQHAVRAKEGNTLREANRKLIKQIAALFTSAVAAKKITILDKAKELTLVDESVTADADFLKGLGQHEAGPPSITANLAELEEVASRP